MLCALCGYVFVGCGRKGPPLAPIVYLPRPVTELAAKRVEDEVVIQFKVPTTNTDNTGPADLQRIDVYAHTGPLPSTADFLKYGTLVQSIEIKEPVVDKPEEKSRDQKTEAKEAGAATPADSPPGVKPYTPELTPPGAPAAPPAAAESALPAPEQEATAPAAPEQTAKAPAGPAPEPPAKAPEAVGAATVGAAVDPRPGMIEQGWVTTVRERLTEKDHEIGPMPPTRPTVEPDKPVQPVVIETLETPGTVNFEPHVARYYTIVGVSRSRHRRGPYAGPVRIPLVQPLQPPDTIETDYTETAILLSWPTQPEDIPVPAAAPGSRQAPAADDAAAAAMGEPQPAPPANEPAAPSDVAANEPTADPNQETQGTYEIYADVETEGTVDAPRPAAPPIGKPQPPPTPRFGYNVYDAADVAALNTPAPDVSSGPAARARVAPPVAPLNARLLTSPTFEDARLEFGTERCYVVRRVEMAGNIAVESAPSPPVCLTPVDKFPPAAPKALTSVASGTAVSLIWDANTESDLGGYLILRGEAPGDKLAPLTPAPFTDASYVDTSVRRNRTYVYEVIAVDKTGNQSAASNRVEEPIR